MVLNRYRDVGDRHFGPVAERLVHLDPNTLTWWSLLFALGAGVSFALADGLHIDAGGYTVFPLLFLASALVFVSGGLDALDGKVARLTGRESPRGDYLDHVLDRLSDVLIMGGIMLSAFCDVLIGALAIIMTLLVSYMGTQAQAVGCGRDYGGIMGRADRLLMLILVPILQLAYNLFEPSGVVGILGLTFIELMMLVFIVTGAFTVVHRGANSWRELGEMERPRRPGKRRGGGGGGKRQVNGKREEKGGRRSIDTSRRGL